MLIIGVLIGFAFVLLWSPKATETGENEGATTTDVEMVTRGKPLPELFTGAQTLPPQIPANTRVGLTVLDQPRGTSVFVSGLQVIDTRWVAVYDDREGKPGWILGAARVRQGDAVAVVPLLRPEGTLTGATYYAAILNDDGDDEFNRLLDLPPLTPDKVTIVSFKAE